MNPWAAFGIGLGVGLLVGLQLRASETSCCKRVAAAIRDEVNDRSPTAAAVGDLFNVWGAGAGAMDWLGVPADYTG